MAEAKVYFYSFDEARESIGNYLERFAVYCELQDWKSDKDIKYY